LAKSKFNLFEPQRYRTFAFLDRDQKWPRRNAPLLLTYRFASFLSDPLLTQGRRVQAKSRRSAATLLFLGKAVAVGRKIIVTEYRFPHVVEIAIPPLGLDSQTSREIVDFHRSRNIQVRFGHAIKNVCRWCFSDAATAEAFKEQFNGKNVVKRAKTAVKRTMPNIIAAAFISHPIACLISLGAELAAPVGLI
jgi:hypothetical protein